MSKQIQGTFLSFIPKVNEETSSGKAYDFFKIRYQDDKGSVKTYRGMSNSLKFNRKLSAALGSLNEGDNIILVFGNNKAGFEELQDVSVIGKGSTGNSSSGDNGNGGSNNVRSGSEQMAGKPAGRPSSSYETAEERAARQELIVRQSSLAQAVEVLKGDGKKIPSFEDITSLASKFSDWVFGKKSQAQLDKEAQPAKAGSDIPFELDDDVPL